MFHYKDYCGLNDAYYTQYHYEVDSNFLRSPLYVNNKYTYPVGILLDDPINSISSYWHFLKANGRVTLQMSQDQNLTFTYWHAKKDEIAARYYFDSKHRIDSTELFFNATLVMKSKIAKDNDNVQRHYQRFVYSDTEPRVLSMHVTDFFFRKNGHLYHVLYTLDLIKGVPPAAEIFHRAFVSPSQKTWQLIYNPKKY